MTATKPESEIVVFCKIGNAEGLKQADSVVEQQQLELYIDGKGRIRMRKTTTAEGTIYEQTMKTIGKMNGAVKSVAMEEETMVPPSFFEGFKQLASKLLIKKRYVFKGEKTTVQLDGKDIQLPPVIYEVDVFEKPDGTISPWAKIDVEVDQLMEAFKSIPETQGKAVDFTVQISDLPFVPQEAFIAGQDMTEEQKRLVNTLWNEEWSHHPTGGALQPAQPSIASQAQEGEQDDDSTNQPSDDKMTGGEENGSGPGHAENGSGTV